MSGITGSHWLEREDFGKVTVVRFKTPKILDEETAREVFGPIYTIVGIGRNQLVLNLKVVEYLPSMALGKLVMLNRKVGAAEGGLALCELTPFAREVLETTHLDSLFNIFATEEEALASFS